MSRKLIAVLMIGVIVLLSAGCSAEREGNLRIGICLWPGYEPFFLARDLGFYDDLPITIIEYPSPSGAARAMRSGTIDAVALTLDEVLLLSNGGVDGKVVLVTDISVGGDAILAHPTIDQFQQLEGKRIGSESTVLANYMLSRALNLQGMSLSDIEQVYYPVSEHLKIYQRGEVDAVVTFEPVKTQLLNAGANELFSSAEIPAEIVDVLMVSQSYIDQHPEVVRQLINGWYQALNFFEESPERAYQMISNRLQITPKEVVSSYQGLHLPGREEVIGMLDDDGLIEPVANRLQQTMIEQQLIHAANELNPLFIDDLLR